MRPTRNKPLEVVGLAGVAWTIILWALSDYGYIQAARDVFASRGGVVTWVASIVFSQWVGPVIAVGCLGTYLWIQRPRRTGARNKPPMGLFASVEAVPKASAEIHAALTNMTKAMTRWQEQAAVQKSKAKNLSNKSARDQYWHQHARMLDRLSNAIDENRKGFRAALQTMRDAFESRVYWHAERNTASEFLSMDAKRTFSTLYALTSRTQETFIENKAKLDKLEGWDDKVTKSSERHKAALDGIVNDLRSLQVLLEDMLSFRRQWTGVRGYFRRAFYKLRNRES